MTSHQQRVPSRFDRRAFCASAGAALLFTSTARADFQTIPRGQPVLTAPRIVGPIPVTTDSVPYGSSLAPGSITAALMQQYDYVEEEYFLFGYANIYGPGMSGVNTVGSSAAADRLVPLGGLVQAEMPYATRILMARPRDNSKFSGRVHAYTFHNLNAFVHVDDFILRNGDAILGLEGCSGTRFGPNEVPSGGIAQLHRFNRARYRDLLFSHASPQVWPDLTPGNLGRAFATMQLGSGGASSGIFLQEISRSYAQAPDVMTQLAHALKTNDPAFPFEGGVRWLYNFAASGGTTIQQPYIDLHHAAGMLPDGRPPFDGYFVLVGKIPLTRPPGAVVAFLESEADLITANALGRPYFPDTDRPRFRFYQLPGTGHGVSSSSPTNPFARPAYMLSENVSVVPDGVVGLSQRGAIPAGVVAYDKVNTPILWGVWHNMYRWVEHGVPMPRAPRIRRDASAPDNIARDRHGNAVGGLRTPWVDVPDGAYVARISQQNPLRGGLRPFTQEHMNSLYGSRAHYLQLVNRRIDRMVSDRWVLHEDADLMRLPA